MRLAARLGKTESEEKQSAGGKPIQNSGAVLVRTPLSQEVSEALNKRGFKFEGPVIVYAWMQAVEIANDRAATCFPRKAVPSGCP